jgi:feruloyl-CoA synthase
VPNYGECRSLDPELDPQASYAEIVASARVRETFARLLAGFNQRAGGSSQRLKRIVLIDDPPSLDSGELTDKGSINQRAALEHRAADVEALYAGCAHAKIIG